MPVSTGGRGYSQHHTPTKQTILESIINRTCQTITGFRIQNSRIPYTFHWIDAYSGPGINPEVSCDGSPLIFQNTVIKNDLPYKAFCIDSNPDHITELKTRIGYDPGFRFFVGDNSKVVPEIVSEITDSPYGILYLDPNGEPNWDMAETVAYMHQFKHMDILMHFTATSYKRSVGAGIRGEDIVDRLKSINKRHWFICPCHHIGSDKHQWVMVLGTNYDKWKGLKRLGFFDINTPMGEALLNTFNHNRHTLPEDMKASQKPLTAFFGVA